MEQYFTSLGIPCIGFALCYVLLKQNFKVQETMMQKFDRLSESIDKLADRFTDVVKEELKRVV
jgi:hypothetical protein